MPNSSRDLLDAVVRALAKVGLVWALVVLGALFMASSAAGIRHDGGYSLAAADAATSVGAPRAVGVALAVIMLSSGLAVLAYGATGDRRPDRRPERRVHSRAAGDTDGHGQEVTAREPAPEPTAATSHSLELALLS